MGYRLDGLGMNPGTSEIIIRDAWRTRKTYDTAVANNLIKEAGYDPKNYLIKEKVLQEGMHEFDLGGGHIVKQYGYLVRLSIFPKPTNVPKPTIVPKPIQPKIVPHTFLDDVNEWFKRR